MKLKSLFEAEKREKHFSRLKKKLNSSFRHCEDTTPLFIFGQQRSGTTMLMDCFHFHQDIDVYDERDDSVAFTDYRLRNYSVIDELIVKSKFKYACFKSLADSHLASDVIDAFPNGKFIWMYRSYQDVANSYLRKFPHATEAIKKVIENKPGGGWFQEGVSERSAEIIRDIYIPSMSEFDLASLAWWLRNELFFEKNLYKNKDLLLISYGSLVQSPKEYMPRIFSACGIEDDKQNPIYKYVHNKSIAKNKYPDLHPSVKQLCEKLTQRLSKSEF